LRLAAQKNGTENPLNINELQHTIAAARVTTVRNASIGAAVELSPRASRRSLDG
jgi:ribosomal protein L29